MRHVLPLLFCLGVVTPFAGADEVQEKPTLVLDAGGHTTIVWKVLFTPDGRELISVSFDKTLRIWDVSSGELLRVLRPPIGKGLDGMLYSAAVSPNGRTLAVTGYGFGGGPYPIYLLDLSSGAIERTLLGHNDSIMGLAFSPDGKRLASSSYDQTARLWEVATGRCERVFEGHTSEVYGVAYSPDGRRIATASFDKTARVWSTETGRVEAVLRGHTKEVKAVAWSPNGNVIATGGWDQSVRLWGPDGKSYRGFDNLGNQVQALAFTPDSREVLATLGGDGVGRVAALLLNLASGKDRITFTEHNSTVLGCAMSPDGTIAASAGGGDDEIYLWKTADGTMTHRLVGKGRGVWNVGWSPDGRIIGWGNTYQFQNDNLRGPVDRGFDVAELELASITNAAAYVRAKPSRGSVSLKLIDTYTLGVERAGAATVPLKMIRKYDQIRAFTLLPDDRVAIAGEFGLYLFNAKTGQQLKEFQGHTGVVWAVAPSPDGRLILSASSDQTVRVWDPERDEPLLSLFVAGDDWVAWTPEGYYAASAGGEKLMGWHVGNGKEKMGNFYPTAKFRKAFYRPDVIKLVLSTGGTDRAMEFADRAKGRKTEKIEVTEVLPPVVSITSPTRSGKTVDSSKLLVKAVARSRGEHPVTVLRLLLDGRPYQGQAGVKSIETPKLGEVNVSWTVELEPGVHKLAVQAESEKSQGLSDAVEVNYAAEQDVVLPSLYVLAIGVSAYPGDLQLHYAAADAIAVEKAFQSKSGTLFKKVEVKRLTDEGAKRKDILGGLTWLRRQMTQRDVGVVFFSGHGMRDGEGSLYLLPVDADPDDLLATAVADDQLKKAMGGMPGRVLAMLDACHAGAAGGDKRKAPHNLTDDLVRDLVTDDYGVIVMASSTGREFSLENNSKRQSNFTLAIVEGLSGAADYNKDNVVYLNELDNYVSDRVKDLSKGQQHPVSARPTSVRSFPLSRP